MFFLNFQSLSIKTAWKRLKHQYEALLTKKAYVHHYENEGFDLADFSEALENVETLIQDYEDVDKQP